ncbi:hypothetical protein Fot_22050 [Forsythia ovata]|uniref:Uncharacterized protein n=1 Tax=Forsythia ovata TaxID=205694 RepID=A0ABD1UWL9_9LAMI
MPVLIGKKERHVEDSEDENVFPLVRCSLRIMKNQLAIASSSHNIWKERNVAEKEYPATHHNAHVNTNPLIDATMYPTPEKNAAKFVSEHGAFPHVISNKNIFSIVRIGLQQVIQNHR